MNNRAVLLENSQTGVNLLDQLGNHPLYRAIDSIPKLRKFMQYHVFAVWDFMSLVKTLQRQLAPTTVPWVPPGNHHFASFINQMVLEEESDQTLTTNGVPLSHFEIYVLAMREIDADTRPISEFVATVKSFGLNTALQNKNIPVAAKNFMRFTFEIIDRNRPHLSATVLAYGRETLVPLLFRCLRNNIQISEFEAPYLHAYLNRHIELDEHEHGPMVMRMAQELCGTSTAFRIESDTVAQRALRTRLTLWDDIYRAL